MFVWYAYYVMIFVWNYFVIENVCLFSVSVSLIIFFFGFYLVMICKWNVVLWNVMLEKWMYFSAAAADNPFFK